MEVLLTMITLKYVLVTKTTLLITNILILVMECDIFYV